MIPRSLLTLSILAIIASGVQAQELPPAGSVVLRLEPGGPTSLVTGLAFAPDGKSLYVGGMDKVVRVWTRDDAKTPAWSLSDRAIRVPVGPGAAGGIGALAVSPDGDWLAVGGLGVFRGGLDFHKPGVVVPSSAKTKEMLEDEGVIYAINLKSGAIKALRGHHEAVTNLAFAPAYDGKPPLLVSTGYKEEADESKDVGQVRVWDVSTGKSVADRTVQPKNPSLRPGLAVRHTGKELDQVVVALAWFDKVIRFWDVKNNDLATEQDGTSNATVVYHSEGQPFVTAASRSRVCQLTGWSFADGPPRDKKLAVLSPADASHPPFFAPQSLALLPIPGKSKDAAAVIVRRQGENVSGDDTEELVLVDLTSGDTLAKPRSLGPITRHLRLPAATRDGRYLAVADGDGNRVLIFSVADLLADRGEPQELRGVGTTFRYAAFAKNGADRGLVLSGSAERLSTPPRPPADGDLIFDLAGRKLTTDLKAWKLDAPDVRDWAMRTGSPERGDPDRRPFLAVRRPGVKEETVLRLSGGTEVTAFAAAPDAAGLKIPVLAVASLDRHRQPVLALYRADNGNRVRQFTGHVGTIRSLAFSGDGRLLISAADDQTVSVWTLMSLEEHLKKGQVRGLAVQMNGKQLVVSAVGAGSLLKVGDALEGLVLADKTVRPFLSALDFYEAVLAVGPGKEVTVRVNGKDVDLPVVQAIDDRKPLLSLFVTRGDKLEERLWIGWNPTGPYEVSADGAERYLGWHFNTGKADDPTSFARVDQYKKDHEKKGILQKLVRHGRLEPALEEWKKGEVAVPPDPRIGIVGLPADGPKIAGRLLIRRSDEKLRLTLNPDFRDERVTAATWMIRRAGEEFAGAPLKFDPQPDREWTADLAQIKWQRGTYEIRATIQIGGDQPREYQRLLDVHYLPKAPSIAFDPALDGLVIRGKPLFRVQAGAESPLKEQKVAARYRNRSLGDDFTPAADPAKIDAEIALKPGQNIIEIEAKNADARDDPTGQETDSKTFSVFLAIPKEPRVRLLAVTEATGAGRRQETGPPLVVSTRSVKIEGEIESDEAFKEAAFQVGKDKVRVVPSGEGRKKAAFTAEVTLEQRGRQQLAFTASVDNSPPSRPVLLDLNYLPPLPEIVLDRRDDGATVFENGTVSKKPAGLRARLLPLEDPIPFKAEVTVNGELQKTIDVAAGAPLLSADLVLKPGHDPNRVEVRLSHIWGGSVVTRFQVKYLRPPQIDSLVAGDVDPKGQVDFTLRVSSPADLPPPRLLIDDLPEKGVAVEQVPQTPGVWRLVARKVPLAEGSNRKRMRVVNDESSSVEKQTEEVVYKPEAEKARVTIRAPEEGGAAVERREFLVDFEVASRSQLQRVRFRLNEDRPLEIDVSAVKKNDVTRLFEVQQKLPITLANGVNLLRVEAVNEGGEVVVKRTVSLTQRPVTLVVSHFTLPDGVGPPLKTRMEKDEQGRVVFESVEPGRVQLHGHVEWSDAQDQRMRQKVRLRVFVNGFQQIPVHVDPPEDSNRRTFHVNVLLSLKEKNTILLDLPELPLNTDRTAECLVKNCKEPAQGMRLHLLVVGIGGLNGEKLKREALKALGATEPDPKNGGKVSAPPAFQEVRVYGPVVREVNRGKIISQLENIKDEIARHQTGKVPTYNDLVMLYYQGEERITPEGHFFLTDYSIETALEETAVSLHHMTQKLADTRGAQLVLLDVARVAQARDMRQDGIAQWPKDQRIGIVRFARMVAAAPKAATTSELLAVLAATWKVAVNLGSLESGMKDALQQLEKNAEPGRLYTFVYVPAGLRSVTAGKP